MSQSLFNLGGATIGAVVDNPAVIGTIFSLFSVGAIASALLFGPAYKFLKAYAIPAFWVVGIVGYVLWYAAHVTGNVPLFYVAIVLAGFGTNTMTVGVPMLLSTFVAPAIVGTVMGFSYVFQNGGGFLASPIDQVVSLVDVYKRQALVRQRRGQLGPVARLVEKARHSQSQADHLLGFKMCIRDRAPSSRPQDGLPHQHGTR